MKRVLIDTNIYSYAMRGVEEAIKIVKFADEVILCPVVIAELLTGFKGGAQAKKNIEQLENFMSESRVRMISIDDETARRFSEIHLSMRKKGTPIPAHDLWIAACSMQCGALLVTRDGHYKNIDGLYADFLF